MKKRKFDPYRQVDVTRQPLHANITWRDCVIKAVVSGLLVGFALMLMFGLLISLCSAEFHNLLPRVVAVLPFRKTVGVVINPLRGWLFKLPVFSISVTVSFILFYRFYRSSRLSSDDSGLNGYENDMRIMLPQEMTNNFAIVPDSGVHFDEDVTCLLSHIMLNNHGVKPHAFAKHYDHDVLDEHGNVLHYKDDIMYDKNGNVVREVLPVFDKALGETLFDIPCDPPVEKRDRVWYDPTKLLYNPNGRDHDRTNERTVAEKIKNNWFYVDYELRRPAGIYVASTKPQNVAVFAETRAGKGQRVIEPSLDVWSRQKVKSNIVINDPKGELLVRFYYPFVKRGFSVYSFNLVYPNDSAIYNPLGYAAEACRMGRYDEENTLVKQLADVFFSSGNNSEKFWDTSSQAAFMQAAYGLIDYYMEEENELRDRALNENWSTSQLNNALDELWGHVTLYNVYQMITVLAAKKSNDPNIISLDGVSSERGERGKDDTINYDAQGSPVDVDFLSLFFKASAMLPLNGSRAKVMDAHNSLESLAKSDKTISTVYGVCVTNLSIFADEPIKRMTSGRPSQNFDMKSLGAPRYFTIHLSKDWLERHGLYNKESRCVWHCYRKPADGHPFQVKDLLKGDDFSHDSKMNAGWIECAFAGIFPDKVAYIKCDILTPANDVAYTFYFKFVKHYKRSMDGSSYTLEPATQERIIEGGSLIELRLKRQKLASGKIVHKFVKEMTMYTKRQLNFAAGDNTQNAYKKVSLPVIDRKEVRYSEKPKVVDLIIPPHLTAYAPVLLLAVDQMFNMNYQLALSLKPSGKPLLMTKYMLDECGNMQSNGKGLKDFDTKLSIGLGQLQQFTLIYQALQQIKATNGDSKEKTIEANIGEVIYLKSKDNDTLSFLENMTGVKHQTVHDSRSITHHVFGNFNEMKANESYTVKEMPVITKTDMLKIGDGDNMVFGKHNPIWSHNQLILPMSFELYRKQLHAPGIKKYTLSTVPTISHAGAFDLEHNLPDFYAIVRKRVDQARLVVTVEDQYKKLTGLTDSDINQLDKDDYSRDIMRGINEALRGYSAIDENGASEYCEDDYKDEDNTDDREEQMKNADNNSDFTDSRDEHQAEFDAFHDIVYFDHTLSRSNMVTYGAFGQGHWLDLLNDSLAHYLINGRRERLIKNDLEDVGLRYKGDCLYYQYGDDDSEIVQLFAPCDEQAGVFLFTKSGLSYFRDLAQNKTPQDFDNEMIKIFGKQLFEMICDNFKQNIKHAE